MSIGYFSQDQLDELRAGETVLQHVRDLEPNWPPAKQRGLAARMGFGPEKIDTKVERLSGGEKVRLLLGLMAHEKPHVLILDEPTSHLDIDSREALIHAINDYEGAVLLITHDIYLAEACADRLWLVHSGRVRPYDGDLEDYRTLVLSADRGAPKKAASAESAPPPSLQKASGKTSAFTLKQRLASAEKALEAAQAALAALDTQLADPELFAKDRARSVEIIAKRAAAAATLAAAEEAWLRASVTHDAEV